MTEFLTQDLMATVGPVRKGIPGSRGLGLDVSMRDVLDEASRRIDKESAEGGRFADKPLVEAAIRACLGETYFEIDVPSEAERHLERALELQREELGEEHRDTLKSMRTLGVQYMLYGRPGEARPLLNKAYELARQFLGDHDRQTILAQCSVALVHETLGEHEEAEHAFRAQLEACRKHLGEGDILTLGAMEGLGRMAERLGRWTEAESWYLQGLELQREFLGDEELGTLTTSLSLGLFYRNRGRLEEAAVQLEAAAERLQRGWSASDNAVRALAGLAAVRKDQGRLAEAREACTRALELRARRARGPEAPASEKNEYAWELLSCEPPELQDPETALAFALEANELTKHANPNYLDTLALAFQRTGETERALETQKRALELLPPGDSLLRNALEARLAELDAQTSAR